MEGLDVVEDLDLAVSELAVGGGFLCHTQMVPQSVDKIKHMFEFHWTFVGAGVYLSLIEQMFETFPKGDSQQERSTMSAITLTNQGFSANPSRRVVLNRRGRLARTLVVLSLAIVAASVAGGAAGASTAEKTASSAHFITITVAPGETLWSLANRVSGGRGVQALVSEIVEANNLTTVDVAAGDQIRIPLAG